MAERGDPGQAGALDELIGHSITYRIAVGLRGGVSLRAGLDIQRGERTKLERLCRNASRLPVAAERVALRPSG